MAAPLETIAREDGIQLEFPFLASVRTQCYLKAQKEYMDAMYRIYEYDGDFGKRMTRTDFMERIYIKGGFAKQFHERNFEKFFYDVPDCDLETLYKPK